MAGQLIGPQGQPIGPPPVVAHVIQIDEPRSADDIRAISAWWQQTTGVPAVVLAGGPKVVAMILADGELRELEMDPEMSVRVAALFERHRDRPAGPGVDPRSN